MDFWLPQAPVLGSDYQGHLVEGAHLVWGLDDRDVTRGALSCCVRCFYCHNVHCICAQLKMKCVMCDLTYTCTTGWTSQVQSCCKLFPIDLKFFFSQVWTPLRKCTQIHCLCVGVRVRVRVRVRNIQGGNRQFHWVVNCLLRENVQDAIHTGCAHTNAGNWNLLYIVNGRVFTLDANKKGCVQICGSHPVWIGLNSLVQQFFSIGLNSQNLWTEPYIPKISQIVWQNVELGFVFRNGVSNDRVSKGVKMWVLMWWQTDLGWTLLPEPRPVVPIHLSVQSLQVLQHCNIIRVFCKTQFISCSKDHATFHISFFAVKKHRNQTTHFSEKMIIFLSNKSWDTGGSRLIRIRIIANSCLIRKFFLLFLVG